jgi:hypothetical protein
MRFEDQMIPRPDGVETESFGAPRAFDALFKGSMRAKMGQEQTKL